MQAWSATLAAEERMREAEGPSGWRGQPPFVDAERTCKPDEAPLPACKETRSNWRGTCADREAEDKLGWRAWWRG